MPFNFKEIYQILYTISFFSLLNYYAIFSIILMARKLSKEIIKINENNNFGALFSTQDSYKIISQEISFTDLIFTIIKRNVVSHFKLLESACDIIFKEDNNYSDIFNENHIFYKEIIKNKIIHYDYYHNLSHANMFIKKSNTSPDYVSNFIKIILEFEKYNFQVVSPFYKNNKLFGYLIIKKNSLTENTCFTNNDIEIIYNYSHYLSFCCEQLENNNLYTQLNFQKKIYLE